MNLIFYQLINWAFGKLLLKDFLEYDQETLHFFDKKPSNNGFGNTSLMVFSTCAGRQKKPYNVNKPVCTKYNDGYFNIFSKYSLLEGHLALNLNGLHNLRFYGPYTQRMFKKPTKSDWFNPVQAVDYKEYKNLHVNPQAALSFIVSFLFQSPAGLVLNIASSNPINFNVILNGARQVNDRREDIRILSGLLFCCINKMDDLNYSIEKVDKGCKITIERNGKYKILVLDYQAFLKNKRRDEHLISALQHIITLDDGILDPVMNTKIVLKAFISFYLESQYELKEFYKILKNEFVDFFDIELKNRNYEETGVENFFNYSESDRKFIFKTLKDINEIVSVVPYRIDDALPYTKMPYYLGEGKFSSYDEGFSNCVESSVYYFFNCLLWDPETDSYLPVKKPGEDNELAPISDIFYGNKIKGFPDKEEFKKLHKMIENLSPCSLNLPDENCGIQFESKDAIFDTFYYRKEYQGKYMNELDSGLVQFLKILEKLTARENKEFTAKIQNLISEDNWESTKDVKLAELKIHLKDVIFEILGESAKTEECIEVDLSDLKYCQANRKFDFYGPLTFEKTYKNSKIKKIKFLVEISLFHMEVKIKTLEIKSERFIDSIKSKLPFFIKKSRASDDNSLFKMIGLELINTFDAKKRTHQYNKLFGSDKISLYQEMYRISFDNILEINKTLPDLVKKYHNQSDAVYGIISNAFKTFPLADVNFFVYFQELIYTNNEFLLSKVFLNKYLEEQFLKRCKNLFEKKFLTIKEIDDFLGETFTGKGKYKKNPNTFISSYVNLILGKRNISMTENQSCILFDYFFLIYEYLNKKGFSNIEEIELAVKSVYFVMIQNSKPYKRSIPLDFLIFLYNKANQTDIKKHILLVMLDEIYKLDGEMAYQRLIQVSDICSVLLNQLPQYICWQSTRGTIRFLKCALKIKSSNSENFQNLILKNQSLVQNMIKLSLQFRNKNASISRDVKEMAQTNNILRNFIIKYVIPCIVDCKFHLNHVDSVSLLEQILENIEDIKSTSKLLEFYLCSVHMPQFAMNLSKFIWYIIYDSVGNLHDAEFIRLRENYKHFLQRYFTKSGPKEETLYILDSYKKIKQCTEFLQTLKWILENKI